ncbi:hypothetical protein DICVIV_09487 [Dictyocaulus viviparus]|uniref:Uncharacterized protein n=1 Tax=Dictyocaulus viviparus TaxID=29172 RepID=A0A0D8XKX3_DICVI|nr:hypothetical protein DICVIV_09487 [Dictyocaulus viviparus]
MTFHNIGLHLIGLAFFIVLLFLLFIVCKIADKMASTPSTKSSSPNIRNSSISYEKESVALNLLPEGHSK